MAAREAKCPRHAIVICTDGSGNHRDGLGSWAFVAMKQTGAELQRQAQGVVDTTNNLMEMEAVIQALRAYPVQQIHIVSDSQYVIRGITEWIYGWRKRNWVTGDGKRVKNREKWEEMFRYVQNRDVTFEHVRGHQGHAGNELADQLCTAAVKAMRAVGAQEPVDANRDSH